MVTIMEMLVVFVAILILSLGLGMIAVLIASASKRILPRSNHICSRCINGWKTRRGLRNRLLLTPFCITMAIFVGFTTLDNYTVKKHIKASDHLIVRSGGNCHRRPDREKVLFETTDMSVLEDLSKNITLTLGFVGIHCRCCGDMTFDLYQSAQLIYSFTLHHGRRIRIKDLSRNDKDLTSGSKKGLSKWLEKTGVSAALAKAREEENHRDSAELQEQRGEAQ